MMEDDPRPDREQAVEAICALGEFSWRPIPANADGFFNATHCRYCGACMVEGQDKGTVICPIELFWKHPTPHEEALAGVDEFLRTHRFTSEELFTIKHYYKDARTWGLRHLRLTAASNRLRDVSNVYSKLDPEPDIPDAVLAAMDRLVDKSSLAATLPGSPAS